MQDAIVVCEVQPWEDAINDAQVPSSLIRIDIKPSQIKKW